MESSGEVGKVNISGNTYDLVKDKFTYLKESACKRQGWDWYVLCFKDLIKGKRFKAIIAKK